MKKIFYALFLVFLTASCLNEDDSPNYHLEFIAIDSFIVPEEFEYQENNDITIKYIFPTNCYAFYNLYYEYDENARIIAVSAIIEELGGQCVESDEMYEFTFPIKADQQEDYILKFWKGEDADGNDIYEEIIIPVN